MSEKNDKFCFIWLNIYIMLDVFEKFGELVGVEVGEWNWICKEKIFFLLCVVFCVKKIEKFLYEKDDV